jgi:hypothetical protein
MLGRRARERIISQPAAAQCTAGAVAHGSGTREPSGARVCRVLRRTHRAAPGEICSGPAGRRAVRRRPCPDRAPDGPVAMHRPTSG